MWGRFGVAGCVLGRGDGGCVGKAEARAMLEIYLI